MIRILTVDDKDIINELNSNTDILESLENDDDTIYGLFSDDGILIGFSSVELNNEDASYSKYWNKDSVMINNFFIKDEYRTLENIQYFLEYLIGVISKVTIFLNLLYEEEKDIFNKFGFIEDNNCIVRVVENNNTDEVKE